MLTCQSSRSAAKTRAASIFWLSDLLFSDSTRAWSRCTRRPISNDIAREPSTTPLRTLPSVSACARPWPLQSSSTRRGGGSSQKCGKPVSPGSTSGFPTTGCGDREWQTRIRTGDSASGRPRSGTIGQTKQARCLRRATLTGRGSSARACAGFIQGESSRHFPPQPPP